jgi:hypothetical protein
MGHVRIGFLPRTKNWNAIIEQLSKFHGDIRTVSKIADRTLSAIKGTYEVMPFDESIIMAISYLATLAFSAKQDDQTAYLKSKGYLVDNDLSLHSVILSAQKMITTEKGSLEINKIAKDATMRAIITYQENHLSNQLDLFGNEPQNPLRYIGSGAAFCELTRYFFAFFTDHQIKYYVEREAAQAIDNYSDLKRFSSALTDQSIAIANHAFETSKIMQSFAAGWFNNHAATSSPSNDDVMYFLRKAFGKMREEFRREADGQ